MAVDRETTIMISLLAFRPNKAYQLSIVSYDACVSPAIIGWKVYWSINWKKLIPESMIMNGIDWPIISKSRLLVETCTWLADLLTKGSTCRFWRR